MVLIMEGYLDYGDENWHELPDSESYGVVDLDAYIAAVTNFDQTRANAVYPEGGTTNLINNYVNHGVV